MDRTHLTGLLGNLWQNALEACLRLPPGADRFITATIALRRNKLDVYKRQVLFRLTMTQSPV